MTRPTTTLLALGAGAIGVLAVGAMDPQRDLPSPAPVTVGHVGGELVVDLVDGSTDVDLARVSEQLGVQLEWVHPLAVDESLAEATVPDLAAAVAALQDVPGVEWVEPGIAVSAFGFPNDPMYDQQWHLDAMGAPQGWAETPRGKGVVVAVLDTGVSVVEDLDSDRVLPGASFVPGVVSSADDNGHGTHVAGTIAQSTNNGVGVAGVAPQATILPVKVLDRWGSGTSEQIAAGIDYAVDEGADVINLSLGGSYSRVIHIAVQKARKNGVLVIAAAGNDGRRGVSWPGALEESIGVSATGPDGTLAPYSSYGPGVDIAAPGGNLRVEGGGVLQDTIDRDGHAYRALQGTSMAAPHVSGAAAVLLSTGQCDADCTEETLLRSARGDGFTERFGHGDLDLAGALDTTTDRWPMFRFLLGAVGAFAMASVAGARRRFSVIAALAGGMMAGGVFFLDALPGMSGRWWVAFLADTPLSWPSRVLGAWASRVPVTYSAALPLLLTVPLASVRVLRPVLIGVAAGTGAVLLHAAATGTVQPWLLGPVWGRGWLVLNAVVAGLLALSLAGNESMDRRGDV